MTASAGGPTRPSVPLTSWEQAEADARSGERRRDRETDRWAARTVVIALSWYVTWNGVLHRVIPPPYADTAVFSLTVPRFWWVIASLLTGLSIASVYLGSRNDDARMKRTRRRVCVFLALVATVFALLLRDAYVSFEREAMAVSDFWTLGREQRRPYTEVRTVRLTAFAHGRHASGWALQIRYAWGLPWNSEDGVGGAGYWLEELQQVGAFVAARAGVPLQDDSGELLQAVERLRATP